MKTKITFSEKPANPSEYLPQPPAAIDRIGNFKLQTPSEYFAEQKAKAAGEAARAPTRKNIPRPTDNEIDDWNHRHGLRLTIGDARQAFEDAATSEYAKGVWMNAHAELTAANKALRDGLANIAYNARGIATTVGTDRHLRAIAGDIAKSAHSLLAGQPAPSPKADVNAGLVEALDRIARDQDHLSEHDYLIAHGIAARWMRNEARAALTK